MPKEDTQFKKGQSGNPKGRPKKEWTFAGLLIEVGEEVEPKSKKTFKELLSKKLWIKSVNGDNEAAKIIINRIEGMPKQSTDVTSGGNPIPILGGITAQDGLSSNDSNEETSTA